MRERVITITSMSVVMVTILSLKGHLPLLTFHWNRFFSTIFISILSELSLLYEFPAEPYPIFDWSSPRICTRISSELSYSKSFFLLISPHQKAHWILIKNTLKNLITIFSRFSSESSQEADQNALKTQNLSKILFRILSGYSSKARRNPLRRLISVPVFSSESSLGALQNPMRNS